MQSVEIETPRMKGGDSPETLRWKYSPLLLLALAISFTGFILLWQTYDYKNNRIIQGIQGVDSDTRNQDMSKTNSSEFSQLKLDSLTIVSMNVAGCEPSGAAPPSWNGDNTTEALKVELLRHKPDVLMLQECPSPKWAETTFGENYGLVGTTTSHAGYIALLLRHDLSNHAQTIWPTTDARTDLPAVMAKIHLNNRRSVMVASCHLAPFEKGYYKRGMQIKDLLGMADSVPLIMAGDTNMRDEEDEAIENDNNLRDAWKLAGALPATQFSWDTINHESEGGFFNQYYGLLTREYVRRYDRIYISDSQAGVYQAKTSVQSFELIANTPASPSSTRHFLSDHFGIACKLKL